MSKLAQRARGLVSLRLLHDTSWSLIGEVGRLGTQIVVFVILTYLFDPSEYGVLFGALGLLWFLQPYAGLGATHLLIQRVAGDKWDLQEAIGRGLSVSILGGFAATLMVVSLQPLVLPQVDPVALGFLAVSELVAIAVLELVAFVAVATERLRAMALLRVGHGVARAIGALMLLGLAEDPKLWMWALAATVAAFLTALASLIAMTGGPPKLLLPRVSDFREGVPLSLGFGVAMLSASTDSFLLVRLDQVFDAGIYGAAQRVVGMVRTPARALLFASNARLYDAGARSVREGRDLARRATAGAVAITSAGALVVFIAADLIVAILPADYSDTAEALRWMIVIPVLSSTVMFASTMLTASRLHRYRVMLISASAVVNVTLNILWIPDHGWKGATVASLISLSMYVVAVWAVLEHFVRAEHRGEYTVPVSR